MPVGPTIDTLCAFIFKKKKKIKREEKVCFENSGSYIMDESGFLAICSGIIVCYMLRHQTMVLASPTRVWQVLGLRGAPWLRVWDRWSPFDSACQGNVPHWTVSWLNWFLRGLMIHIAIWCCWSYCFLFCFICLFFPVFSCFLFQFSFRGRGMETPVRQCVCWLKDVVTVS